MMAPCISDGAQARAGFPIGKFRAVGISKNFRTVIRPRKGMRIYGISQHARRLRQPVNVVIFGITKAIAGGKIRVGDDLRVTASGSLMVKRKKDKNHATIGMALESADRHQIFVIAINPMMASSIPIK